MGRPLVARHAYFGMLAGAINFIDPRFTGDGCSGAASLTLLARRVRSRSNQAPPSRRRSTVLATAQCSA